MKTRVLIVDDEQEARNVLSALLKKHSEIEVVAEANNVDAAIVAFLEYRPDIVFLDVQMPRKDGFAFIKSLKNSLNGTRIVFVTAYQKFAIEAIKHSAFDFLLKPISQSELQATINRFHEQSRQDMQIRIEKLMHNLQKKERIKLETRTGFELIILDDIIYLKADNNYSKIYCTEERKIVSTYTLGKLETLLHDSSVFFRLNRSEIININYLSSYNRIKRKCVLYADEKKHEFTIARERIKKFEALI